MKIRKILFFSLLLFAILLLPNVVNATVGDVVTLDGIKYTVLTEQENNYTVKVSGYEGAPTTATIPQTITNSSKTYTVTEIGHNAFINCSSLINIILPDSVVSIGQGAFSGCTALKTVTIPSSVTIIDDDVFINCDLLTLTIEGYPGSVIKNYANLYDIDFKSIYKATNKLTNITSLNETFEDDYTATLRVDAGFILPQSISVKIGDTELSKDKYSYDSTTGEITIPAEQIIADIKIEASTNEQFKVNFDANGGKFSNNKDILILENWENESDYFEKMDNVEEPTKEGYKFLGYYTEKENGTSFKHLMAEVGIDKETTFYAQWEEIKKINFAGNAEKQEFIVGEDKILAFTLSTDRIEGTVLVDGVELNETNGDYSWKFSEGTFPYIELSENYMKALKVGTHTVKFVLDNGNEAETTFTIVEKVIEENKEDKNQENIAEGNKEEQKQENVAEENKGEQKQEDKIEKNESSNELDETPKMGNTNENFAFKFAFASICFVTVISLSMYNKKSRI